MMLWLRMFYFTTLCANGGGTGCGRIGCTKKCGSLKVFQPTDTKNPSDTLPASPSQPADDAFQQGIQVDDGEPNTKEA